MYRTRILQRLAVMLVLILSASMLPSPAATAGTPLATQYCREVLNCRIVIQGPASEGDHGTGWVFARPETEVRLQMFQIIGSGTANGRLLPTGNQFTVMTSAEGWAKIETPVLDLKTLPSSHLYAVGPADLTYDQLRDQGWFVGEFTVLSAYPEYVVTNRVENGEYFTHFGGAAAGEYQLQVERQGKWDSLGSLTHDPTATDGDLTFKWRLDEAYEIQLLRVVNITAGVVVFEGGITRIRPGGGWGDVDNSQLAGRRSLADIVGIDSSGAMRIYFNRGAGRLSQGFSAGGDWSGTNWMAHAQHALVTRTSDGSLWSSEHQSDVFDGGMFTQGVKIGRGWGHMEHLTVVPEDHRTWSLLARTSDGRLLRYGLVPVSPGGPVEFKYVNQLGTGWDGMAKILSTGDLTGDGIADILAIGGNGNLYRYTLNSSGKVVATHHIGRNWHAMVDAFSPGDMDGDGIHDVVARRNDGRLFLYKNYGNGSFGYPAPIGSGWNAMRLLA